MTPRPRAFSLGELLVALGLIAVSVLTVLALSITIARTDRESVDRGVANVVATQLFHRLVDRLRADVPEGTRDDFFDSDHTSSPFEAGELTSNGTAYEYEIYARAVNDTSGTSVGGTTPGNRLKKVDVVLRWWDSEAQSHQGYGELKVLSSRFLAEAEL